MKLLQNKNLRFLLLVAAILIVGVSIAYAVLSTTLTITFNKVTQNGINWNVALDTSGSPVEGTPAGTSATGRTCGDATVTSTTVTVANSSVSKPGDKCTYALTVKNTGSILATLAEINVTKPTTGGSTMSSCTISGASMVCDKITYKLTTDAAGSTLLATNSTIAASANQPVYLVVMYNDDSAVSGTAQTQTGASFSLVYNG